MEGRTTLRRALGADASASLYQHVADDGQAQARAEARRLGREEWLEDPASYLLGHAVPVVREQDFHVPADHPGPDVEASPGRHRIARIGRQVEQHEVEL